MAEQWFLNRFLLIAERKYPESFFLDDIELPGPADDDYDGQRKYSGDIIEIDGSGRLHLWQFVSVRAPELFSGDVIGRLFAYSQIFRMTDPARIAVRLVKSARRRRYDTASERFRQAIRRSRPRFDSWNLVACGGKGCELAGRDDNLLFQLYSSLSPVVLRTRDVNSWPFYQTATGFDLRSLWDLAICGRLSLAEKLAVYSGDIDMVTMAPSDDFDIGSKRDLHLKRKKGFHSQAIEAYFADRSQVLAR